MHCLKKPDSSSLSLLFATLTLLFLASACGSKSKDTVWEMYDIRHPVPAGSTVPVSRVQKMERYYDNDASYTPPTFGTCGSYNIGLGVCE